MTTVEPFTPRSLRHIVAAGDNPLDYMPPTDDALEFLLDELRMGIVVPRAGRDGEVERAREMVTFMESERHTTIPGRDEVTDPEGFARVLHSFTWRAEILETPELIDQAIALLPPAERLSAELSIDQARRPHPLEVEALGIWGTCDGCGGTITPGERALRIGVRVGYSEDSDLECLVWCLACLEGAVTEARS